MGGYPGGVVIERLVEKDGVIVDGLVIGIRMYRARDVGRDSNLDPSPDLGSRRGRGRGVGYYERVKVSIHPSACILQISRPNFTKFGPNSSNTAVASSVK